jgi:hypothetical protein
MNAQICYWENNLIILDGLNEVDHIFITGRRNSFETHKKDTE